VKGDDAEAEAKRYMVVNSSFFLCFFF
jgi:hypothetical protein